MKKKPDTRRPDPKKYFRRKLILLFIAIFFALILAIDARTGFIKKLTGDKTLEIRIRR